MGANSSDADDIAGLFLARRRRRRGSADLLAKSQPGDAAPVVFGDLLFSAASSDQLLTQSARAENSAAFFAPTVTPGAVALSQSARLDNAQTFYALTVTAGGAPQALTQGSRFDNAQTFYAPTVASGVVNLSQSARLDNASVFYASTVAPGAVTLTATRHDNSQAFYGPTVTPGEVAIAAPRLENAQIFHVPSVTPGAVALMVPLFENDQAFFSATITAAGGPQLLTQAARFDGEQIFPASTVTPGGVTLQPSLLVSQTEFFAPTVENLSFLITREQARQLYRIWLLHGLDAGAPLTVTAATRSAGPVTQSIDAADGSLVTIATTQQPDLVAIDPGTMIEELAALHGLGVDLVVTAAQRVAGGITQQIAEAGGTTTVARQ